MDHKVGFDREEVRIVFPHFWNSKLVGYQKRRLDDPRWDRTAIPASGGNPKYKNSPNFPRDSTLYNLDNVTGDHAVVVESVMSVLKAETLGVNNFVATFGGNVTEAQAANLDRFDRLTLIMDNDSSGWHGIQKLYEYQQGKSKIKIYLPPSGIDAGDLSQGLSVGYVAG